MEDDFQKANKQIKNLINKNSPNIFLWEAHWRLLCPLFCSNFIKTKSVLINPAIPPLKDFEIHLGKNENYATGNKFTISKDDISYVRSLHHKKILEPKNNLILLESGDEILNYVESSSYFRGSYIDIFYGGNHSYTSIKEKFIKNKTFF